MSYQPSMNQGSLSCTACNCECSCYVQPEKDQRSTGSAKDKDLLHLLKSSWSRVKGSEGKQSPLWVPADTG